MLMLKYVTNKVALFNCFKMLVLTDRHPTHGLVAEAKRRLAMCFFKKANTCSDATLAVALPND